MKVDGHYKELCKVFARYSSKYTLSKVFNDVLSLALCSFHQTNIRSRLQIKDEGNEELYLSVAVRYTSEELKGFSEVLGILMNNVYQNPYCDLLGKYFTEHITKGQNGQFFTPEPVCDLMVKLQGANSTIEHKNILDPACGSGLMLLRFAKEAPNNYFYGTDSAEPCAKMSTLNFFLNGLRGEVAWMNSLSMEWYGGWQINNQGLGIMPIEKEQSRIWIAPAKEQENTEDTLVIGEQLDLF